MPGQLDSVDFGLGSNTITVKLSTFTVKLPNIVTMAKVDDHTVQATINLSPFLPKWIPPFFAFMLGTRTVQWNLDTGSLNIR